jgi:acyl-CoA thioesterase-1
MYRLLISVFLMANSLPAATAQEMVRIVVLGDSLSAGYGLAPGEGFPAQLQRALDMRGQKAEIIDAGVSGDTTRGGLARLDWSVPEDADAVIVELGANDALRGIGPDITRKSLDQIVTRLKARNQAVLLAGMVAPPNMGDDYAGRFNTIYPELAETHDVALYPFFLDGVAGDLSLNQADGIHPTSEGIALIVEKILPQVETLIVRVRQEAG